MGSLLRKYGFLMLVSLLFFASAGLAQQTTNIKFDSGVGVGGSNIVGSYYVDPYTLTYGSVTTSYAICDDWTNEVSDGETWTASVNNLPLGNVTTNPPIFSPISSSLTQQGLYNELAFLGNQMLLNAGSSPTQQQSEAEISFAIWELTYKQALLDGKNVSNNGNDPFTYLQNNAPGYYYTGALNYLNEAEGQSTYSSSGWEVLTPTTESDNSSTPQEFLIYTPESSSGVLLSADLLGLLGLVFLFRRRLLRPIQ